MSTKSKRSMVTRRVCKICLLLMLWGLMAYDGTIQTTRGITLALAGSLWIAVM